MTEAEKLKAMSLRVSDGRITVFRTGQIAKICKTSPRTVTNWIDTGKLKGYRLVSRGAGKGDRRVARADLIRFMKDYRIPLGDLLEDTQRVLLVGAEAALAAAFCAALPESDQCRVEVAADGFAAGVALESLRPDAVVVCLSMGRSEGLAIARAVRRDPRNARVRLAAVTDEDEVNPTEVGSLYESGVLRRPTCGEAVAALARGLLAEVRE